MALTSSVPLVRDIEKCTPGNRIARLENHEGTSNKYYEVYIVPAGEGTYKKLLTRHGRIGTHGTVTLKGGLLADYQASYQAGILTGGKEKKGYKPVKFGNKASNATLEDKPAAKAAKAKKKVTEAKVPNFESKRLNFVDFD